MGHYTAASSIYGQGPTSNGVQQGTDYYHGQNPNFFYDSFASHHLFGDMPADHATPHMPQSSSSSNLSKQGHQTVSSTSLMGSGNSQMETPSYNTSSNDHTRIFGDFNTPSQSLSRQHMGQPFPYGAMGNLNSDIINARQPMYQMSGSFNGTNGPMVTTHQIVSHALHDETPPSMSTTITEGPKDSQDQFSAFEGKSTNPLMTASPMNSSRFLTFSPGINISSPLQLGQSATNSPMPLSDFFRLDDNTSAHTLAAPKAQKVNSASDKNAPRSTPSSMSGHLLSFLPAFKETVLYDTRGNPVDVDLNVTLSGNFFLSEISPPDDKGDGNDEEDDQEELNDLHGSKSQDTKVTGDENADEERAKDHMLYELTFYRRNLFQVTATVSNAHSAAYAANAENPQQRSRILSLSLAVSVLGSQDKKLRGLLYCMPKGASGEGQRKNDNNNDQDQKSKSDVGEPAIKSIYPTDSGYDNVVSWKRLQFRSATSHNGHRKYQHYFSVCVSVYAELENTQRICIINAYSRPIVVRGRNPRFYQNRNNIVISEIDRDSSVAAAVADLLKEFNSIPTFISSRAKPALNPNIMRFKEEYDHSQKDSQSEAIKKLTQLYAMRKGAGDKLKSGQGSKLPGSSKRRQSSAHASTNIANSAGKLKIKTEPEPELEEHAASEEEVDLKTGSHPPLNERQAYYQQHYISAKPRTSSVSSKTGSKQEDYEYFPMPVNYWLPPVEVVYRPHAIHHPMQLPKAQRRAGFDPNKRYFSAVD